LFLGKTVLFFTETSLLPPLTALSAAASILFSRHHRALGATALAVIPDDRKTWIQIVAGLYCRKVRRDNVGGFCAILRGAECAFFFDVLPPLLPVGKLSFSFRPRGALVQVNPNAVCLPFPLVYNFVQYTEQFCSMY